ncbi:MAG TPA: gamma-glutamylcyclotransferase family protein [Acetobacteraceae bacterium]|nr:gamma-glutamylcyclotransferase family protein [Acetobacteraceae bacterium]
MRLFLYGTLLANPRTAAGMPATLSGWVRVGLRGTRYPTLRLRRGGAVSGAVVDVPAYLLRRLVAYEGPRYRLTRVVVRTATGKTAAHAWIAPGGTRRPWRE